MSEDHSRLPTEPDESSIVDSINRRRYLQVLAAAGFLSAGSSHAAANTGEDRTVEVPTNDNWEAAADDRIEEYRTTDLVVEVTDENGDPVENADVSVEMQEHEYGFGTAVNADTLINETEPGDEYREYITDLFNKTVLENRHKWRFWEEQTALADEATQWIRDRELDLRGHTCIWANRDAYAVPADVEDAMDAGDDEHVYQRTMDHLDEIIPYYGDDVEEWDVVNEVIHEPEMIELIDGEDVDPVEAPVLTEWYERAESIGDAENVQISVNDYNVLVGPYEGTRSDYQRQIEFLLDQGIALDAIGMQCHFSEGETLEPDEMVEGLNLYAQYGPDLRVTEFDMADQSWKEADKADFLYQFLKTAFSHPATGDFVMWGFWDGRHWEDDAPLFEDDWTPKPSYDVYTSLVFDEWWTDETGTTDADGQYATSAFLGDHEITARTDTRAGSASVSLTEASGQETVTVTLTEDVDTSEPPAFGSLSATSESTDDSGGNKHAFEAVTFEWTVDGTSADRVELEVRDDGALVGSATVDPSTGSERIELDAGVRTNGGDGGDVLAAIYDENGDGEQCEGFLGDTDATISESEFTCTSV